ncbi:MAG TPA: hypothetical protein VK158_02435 [Acidobacteriota bacterium]|nr:hypothetical protein [Acidobacteriota bacterium]
MEFRHGREQLTLYPAFDSVEERHESLKFAQPHRYVARQLNAGDIVVDAEVIVFNPKVIGAYQWLLHRTTQHELAQIRSRAHSDMGYHEEMSMRQFLRSLEGFHEYCKKNLDVIAQQQGVGITRYCKSRLQSSGLVESTTLTTQEKDKMSSRLTQLLQVMPSTSYPFADKELYVSSAKQIANPLFPLVPVNDLHGRSVSPYTRAYTERFVRESLLNVLSQYARK